MLVKQLCLSNQEVTGCSHLFLCSGVAILNVFYDSSNARLFHIYMLYSIEIVSKVHSLRFHDLFDCFSANSSCYIDSLLSLYILQPVVQLGHFSKEVYTLEDTAVQTITI